MYNFLYRGEKIIRNERRALTVRISCGPINRRKEKESFMKEVVLNVKGVNKGHYVPGMISGNTLYISGQLSLDLDTREVCPGGIREHMRQALHNIDRVLDAAGLGRKDVVFCRVYVAGMNNWDDVNEEYKNFFGDHKPARIIVDANELHFGCLVEIEAVAECAAV